MRITGVALLILGLAAAAGTTNATTARRAAITCGRELWDLKTLSDPRRNLVDLRPVPTTVAAITARRAPPGISTLRSPGFERVGRGNSDSNGRAERSIGSAGALVPRVLGAAEGASRLRWGLVCRCSGGGERGAAAPAGRASADGEAAAAAEA